MPTFGEFETYGEPIATIEERGHITTVWQARKGGATSGTIYVCAGKPIVDPQGEIAAL